MLCFLIVWSELNKRQKAQPQDKDESLGFYCTKDHDLKLAGRRSEQSGNKASRLN